MEKDHFVLSLKVDVIVLMWYYMMYSNSCDDDNEWCYRKHEPKQDKQKYYVLYRSVE